LYYMFSNPRLPEAALVHFGPELGRCLAARPDCADACDAAGDPALRLAASRGLLGAVHRLLVAGAYADFPGRDGGTPLHAAAAAGHADVVRARFFFRFRCCRLGGGQSIFFFNLNIKNCLDL